MPGTSRMNDVERRWDNAASWRSDWARYRDWEALGLSPEEKDFARHAFQDIRYLLNKLEQLERENTLLLRDLLLAKGPNQWLPVESLRSDQPQAPAARKRPQQNPAS